MMLDTKEKWICENTESHGFRNLIVANQIPAKETSGMRKFGDVEKKKITWVEL